MGEFDVIRQFFRPLQDRVIAPDLIIGIGDDGAVTRSPAAHDLVFSMDTLVEGVHFPPTISPYDLGCRALAVAVSDLAAMGASPSTFTLSLTLPSIQSVWLDGFTRGLGDASERYGIALVGGNMARGPLQLVLQVHGYVPTGQTLRRSGAQLGDLVCVSGTLGDAGEGLRFVGRNGLTDIRRFLFERFVRPTARIELGQALVGLASAAIDISDGLLADLQHVLLASGVGAELKASAIPVSEALSLVAGDRALSLALTAGDDYELCFTLPEAAYASVSARFPVTVIGRVVAGKGVHWQGAPPALLSRQQGYVHFYGDGQ